MQAPKPSPLLQQTVQTVSKPVVPFSELKIKSQFSMSTAHSEAPVVKETQPGLNEVAENESAYLSLDNVKQAIARFAQLKQESGSRQIFITLSSAVISLSGAQVRIEILNEAQREKMNEVKQEMLDHVRKDLNHNGVAIEISVSQQVQETKAYKPADKFKFMAEKNPMLLELKKRFDLDIEY